MLCCCAGFYAAKKMGIVDKVVGKDDHTVVANGSERNIQVHVSTREWTAMSGTNERSASASASLKASVSETGLPSGSGGAEASASAAQGWTSENLLQESFAEVSPGHKISVDTDGKGLIYVSVMILEEDGTWKMRYHNIAKQQKRGVIITREEELVDAEEGKVWKGNHGKGQVWVDTEGKNHER